MRHEQREQDVIPFHTYITKISSRCNLNCTYCFIYNQDDDRWRRQPKLMTAEVLEAVCDKIASHCQKLDKSEISFILHGGEPLLGGARHIQMIARTVRERLGAAGITVSFGMQSNGLLFTEEIGEVCVEHSIPIGISIDGPPEVNDKFRLDLQGRGSSRRLEEKLRLISSPRFRAIFGGFLVVVDPEADPVAILEYLRQFKPRQIDFILPYDNWDRRPRGKEELDATPYGDWLIRAFDHWYENDIEYGVRFFMSIIREMLGGRSEVESVGLRDIDLIVVETNGEIEAVDSLKAAFNGATHLGYNVFDHDFETVARHVNVRARQTGARSLSDKCRACPLVGVCGGGYLPNRYSSERGFDNPSIYCTDLQKIIRHIHRRISADISAAVGCSS